MAYSPKNYSFPNSIKNDLQTSASIATTLNEKQQENVRNLLTNDLQQCPISQLRNRYMVLDLAYYMENMDKTKSLEINSNIAELYANMELPVLQPNINAAHAYLVGTFLTGIPMFGVVADSGQEQEVKAAGQLEAIIYENSMMTGWARALSKAFKDGYKYNVSATEVDWYQRQIFKPITNLNTAANQQSQSSVQGVYRGGNEFKSLDMYNTFMDCSVTSADVHINGDFSGYCERMSLARVYSFMQDLKLFGGETMNHDERLWKSAPARSWHFVPRILSNQINADAGRDWGSFFNWNVQPMQYGTTDSYEVFVYNRRIIPSMLGIENVPDRHNVQIWKFVEINGYIVYAERKSNAHNWMPILFMQPNEDNLKNQAKGLGESLLNFQNLQGTLFRARLASLSRSISDRGLFDPSLINAEDINSRNPAAKIPVRPKGFGSKISDAYYSIPYNDNTAGTIWQEIGNIDMKAGETAQINRAQRGQFTKGNRTLGEFDNIIDNAEAPQQATAILLENQFFIPAKNIVKINTLQYQSTASLPNPNTKELVEINPVDLRQATLEFKMADGLLPKDKILGINETVEAFQMLTQAQMSQAQLGNPAIPQYDLVGMLVEALEARGARISKHKFPGIVSPQVQSKAIGANPQEGEVPPV